MKTECVSLAPNLVNTPLPATGHLEGKPAGVTTLLPWTEGRIQGMTSTGWGGWPGSAPRGLEADQRLRPRSSLLARFGGSWQRRLLGKSRTSVI